MKRMRVWLWGTLAALCLLPGLARGIQAPSVETPTSMEVRVHIELDPTIIHLAEFLGLDDQAWKVACESQEIEFQGDSPEPAAVSSQPRTRHGRESFIRSCLAAARVLTRVVIRQVHRQIIVPIVS